MTISPVDSQGASLDRYWVGQKEPFKRRQREFVSQPVQLFGPCAVILGVLLSPSPRVGLTTSICLNIRSEGRLSGGMRGPGAAPLRMETDDQRKFGYGGDGLPPSDGDDDGSWEPGGDSGAPNPYGLFILLAAGAWALWEYRRPGGSLNPQTKKDLATKRYEAQLVARKKRLQNHQGGGTGTINLKP